MAGVVQALSQLATALCNLPVDSPGEMTNTGDSVKAAASELKTQCANLRTVLDSLCPDADEVRGSWTGMKQVKAFLEESESYGPAVRCHVKSAFAEVAFQAIAMMEESLA
eukprot:7338679-Lingulodinium_polyedra.AAC.1